MSLEIKLGDKLEYVDVKVNGVEEPGVLITPDKCKLLQNLVLNSVQTLFEYEVNTAIQCAEITELKDWMKNVEKEFSIVTEFRAVLFGKPVIIDVSAQEDGDGKGVLSDGWISDFNVILSAFCDDNGNFIDLPELHDYDGMGSFCFNDVEKEVKAGRIENALKLYRLYTSTGCYHKCVELTESELKQKIADSENNITIEEYLTSVELKEDEAIRLTITRDYIVYEPQIVDIKRWGLL